jgi:hypothetical protein
MSGLEDGWSRTAQDQAKLYPRAVQNLRLRESGT